MSGKRHSIRRRLVTGTLASMILILGVIGIAANQVAQHESEEIFSARLATSARVLDALAARQIEKATITHPIVIDLPPELEHASGDQPQETGHPYETKLAFQIWDDEGPLLARSASAPDTPLAALKPGFTRNSIAGEVWQVFVLRSGSVWVLAAEKDEVRQEMVRDLGASILAPLFIGGLLMLAAVNFVLFFNLTPLKDLADRISKRTPGSLAQIELPGMPVELQPIVSELNDLLIRVKAAFEREQRFIDAAAHEIRTPIAALQLHLQNALRAVSAQEREISLAEAMTGLRRMTKLAEQLLAFSRLAAKVDDEAFRPLSLNQICRDVIAVQEPLLEQKGQTIGLDAAKEFTVLGDPYKLERLLHNLIENASLYGASGGDIGVEITESEDRVLLLVSNDGAPIPEGEAEKMFRPYYRIPGRASPGSGLGLAIVKEIADQHHARLEVSRKADGQGTIVTAAFPCVDNDALISSSDNRS